VFQQATEAKTPRMNWTREEIKQIYDTPLMELAFAAVSIIIGGNALCDTTN
jgi:biotin synthase